MDQRDRLDSRRSSNRSAGPIDGELEALRGSKESLDFFAGEYLGEEDAQNPYASPLFGDFTGLPPLLIQVGSVEVLLDDAVVLAERAKEAGVSVTLEIWDEMIHVWHRYYPVLQEAREANARIGEYVRGIVSVNAAAAE